MDWLVAAMVLVGALAYRSATFVYGSIARNDSARLTVTFTHGKPWALRFLKFYVIVGLPLAFLNGYLIRLSWIDCIVVGVGTWVGMLAAIFFTGRRFNPILQFYVFAVATIAWLLVDAVRAYYEIASRL